MSDWAGTLTLGSPSRVAPPSTESLYDPVRLLGRAQALRREAAATSIPGLRASCLVEAIRWEEAVQRSFETPAVTDGVSMRSGTFKPTARRWQPEALVLGLGGGPTTGG
jgi:hypothetical protein